MAIENFNIGQSSNYIPNYALPLSDSAVVNLAANTDTTVSIPSDAANVLISATDNIFVGSSTITLPASGSSATDNVFVGSSTITLPASGSSEMHNVRLNPEVVSLKGLTQLHVLAPNACYVTLTWFRNANE